MRAARCQAAAAAPHVRLRVALGSGALRGAYQYGFFKQLERLDAARPIIEYDKVHGASIGSFNAPFIAAKRASAMERMWEADDPVVEVMLKESAHELLASTGASRMAQCLVLLCLRGHWFKGVDTAEMRALWREHRIQVPESVEVMCVSFDVTTHRDVWIRITDVDSYIDGIQKSAALPAMMPNYVKDGRWFIDGGIIEYVPVSRLYDPDFQGLYLVFDNGGRSEHDPRDAIPIVGHFEKMLTTFRRLVRTQDVTPDELPQDRTFMFRPVPLYDGSSIFGTRSDLDTWIAQGEHDARAFYEGTLLPRAACGHEKN